MFRNRRRSTPQGEHRPVLLDEVLSILEPRPGGIYADCTLGYAGHAAEILTRSAPDGILIGFDLDAGNLERARAKLEPLGGLVHLEKGNFASLPTVMGREGIDGLDGLLADLGMSSMQVDDAERGFSFMRDGPLDMRMDCSRGKTAADLLATIPLEELTQAIAEVGDEPQAEKIATAIVEQRDANPILRTRQLMELVQAAAPVQIDRTPGNKSGTERQQRLRPVARVFQTLRILVNRELANLRELLRVLPWCLKPGGRAAIISFHSGEDRLVKAAFRDGLRSGIYAKTSDRAMRPGFSERMNNPRSRSAKMRWAERATA